MIDEIAEVREDEREKCARRVLDAVPEILDRRGLASGVVARYVAEEITELLRGAGE
jgi:hypothetical protein